MNNNDLNNRYIKFLLNSGITIEILDKIKIKPVPVYPESITIIKVDDGVVRRINLDNGETIITIMRNEKR